MTALGEARLHLAKAREFLDAAEASRHLGLDNAAASESVISAINSKDAIEWAARIYAAAEGVVQDR